MYGLLTELTDRHESAQPHPWRVDDAPRDFTERLMDSIVGVSFQIRRMEGKWKVSQNQPAENRRSVVDGLQAQGGQDGSSMATLVDVFGKR
jgi:transcriptional regulator